MGGGVTRYHAHGLLVPALIAISPVIWNRIPLPFPRPFTALLWGTFVGLGMYLVFSFAPLLGENHAMVKAMVLGLLTAETLVVSGDAGMPSAPSILLFLYVYVHSAQSADGGH